MCTTGQDHRLLHSSDVGTAEACRSSVPVRRAQTPTAEILPGVPPRIQKLYARFLHISAHSHFVLIFSLSSSYKRGDMADCQLPTCLDGERWCPTNKIQLAHLRLSWRWAAT